MSRNAGANTPANICQHCGLSAAEGDEYCCYGCYLASQIVEEAKSKHSHTRGALTFSLLLSMFVMMLSLFLYAEDIYGETIELEWLRSAYRIISAFLTLPVLILCGVPLAIRSFQVLRAGKLSLDILILSGATSAYVLSWLAMLNGWKHVYFDSAAISLVLATLGRYLEATAREKASALLSPFLKLASEPVLALDPQGKKFLCSPAKLLPDMTLYIKNEQVIPVDITLITETAEIDLAVLTGESTPVIRHRGNKIPSGAIPVSGTIEARVLHSARESTLEQLSALAIKLRQNPSQLTRIADRFASLLLPFVWLLACCTCAFWLMQNRFDRAVTASLAVVLVACPCTYGVSIPLLQWLGLRKALQHGVLFRDTSAFEELSSIKSVAFDKTGTLTLPVVTIQGMKVFPGTTKKEVISLVASLEEESRHPVGRALLHFAMQYQTTPVPLKKRWSIPSQGVVGIDKQNRYLTLGQIIETGTSDLSLYRDNQLLATFSFQETLRPEAKETIFDLQKQGIKTLLLTGDSSKRATQVADSLHMKVYANLSAQEKLEWIKKLGPDTAMIGDGLNDAPALASTRLSFAIQESTGLSHSVSHINLIQKDLRLIPWSIRLAKRSFRLGKRLLIGSLIYNVCFLALAAIGALLPVWAGLSMLVSSLFTLGNVLQILHWPGPETESPLES